MRLKLFRRRNLIPYVEHTTVPMTHSPRSSTLCLSLIHVFIYIQIDLQSDTILPMMVHVVLGTVVMSFEKAEGPTEKRLILVSKCLLLFWWFVGFQDTDTHTHKH